METKIDAAFNARPPELSPPPLSLYSPIFYDFRKAYHQQTDALEFTSSELEEAASFIEASLPYYVDETARLSALEALRLLDRDGFWRIRVIDLGGKTMQPDGTSFTCRSDFPADIFISLQELKNGAGNGGCDPSEQAQCAYISLWSSPRVISQILQPILH
jgi:hypothetical protein